MAMLPGLRPLRETFAPERAGSVNGGYDIYVQDERDHAEARTYYMAKWMKLAAGAYTLKFWVDDSGTLSIDKVLRFSMTIAGAVQSQNFSIAANDVYRWDLTYTELPNDSPSFITYALFKGDELIEVSRADGWVGDIVPIPDSALGPKPPYNSDERLSYPVFLAPPDYSTSIIERLEWNTDVMSSESGAEQRRRLRHFPRRSIEAAFLAHGDRRGYIDAYINGVGSSNGLVPLWWDRSTVTSKSVAGSIDLFADISLRDFNPNDVVIIRHSDQLFDYELNIVASIAGEHIVLAYGLQKDVLRGSSVTPVRVARLLDMPTGSNITDHVRQYSIRFSTVEAAAVDEVWNLPVYSRTNLCILTRVPNFKEAMSLGFERMNFGWDNEIGNIYNRDPGAQAFTNLQMSFHVYGREDMLKFKQTLYKLAGRWREIHIPSQQDDIVLSRNIDSAAGALIAHRFGYQQYAVANQNVRRDILIETFDGQLYPNTIISARVVGDEEWLTLSETVPAIPKEMVRRISYMSRARLDIDTIEINRLTDSDGVSQIPLTFRTMSERRSAPPINFQ
jgi:hypothetical protein